MTVSGYSQTGAIAKMPLEIGKQLSGAVARLQELDVAPLGGDTSSVRKSSDPQGDVGKLSGKLIDVLGKTQTKASGIGGQLSMDGMDGRIAERFEQRLGSLSKTDADRLKSQLHYSGVNTFFSKSTPEDRLAVRSAVVSAFARGASLETTAALRQALDKADANTKADVLSQLNQPFADPAKILAKLTGTADSGPQVTKQDADVAFKYIARTGGADLSKVNEFISANFDTSSMSEVEEHTLRTGLLAINSYTGDTTFQEVNSDLRSAGAGKKTVDPDIESFAAVGKHALCKLPDFKGIVMRGASGWRDAALEKYVPGERVTEHSFTSSSSNGGFAGDIQFVIESQHGKDVSGISVFGDPNGPDGREVLFAPGTQFDVLDRTQGTDKNGKPVLYIVMREVA